MGDDLANIWSWSGDVVGEKGNAAQPCRHRSTRTERFSLPQLAFHRAISAEV